MYHTHSFSFVSSSRSSERVFYEKLTKHLFIILGDDDDEEVVNTFFIHVLPRRILKVNS